MVQLRSRLSFVLHVLVEPISEDRSTVHTPEKPEQLLLVILNCIHLPVFAPIHPGQAQRAELVVMDLHSFYVKWLPVDDFLNIRFV